MINSTPCNALDVGMECVGVNHSLLIQAHLNQIDSQNYYLFQLISPFGTEEYHCVLWLCLHA